MDIIGLLKAAIELINKLISIFQKTAEEKKKESRDENQKENEEVKNGGLPG